MFGRKHLDKRKLKTWAITHAFKKRPARGGTWLGYGILLTLVTLTGVIVALFGPFPQLRNFSTSGGTGLSTGGCGVTGPSLPISGTIVDQVTSAALGATTTIDVIVPTVTTYAAPYESPTQSSSVYTTKYSYPPCTTFLLHISSTAGNKYYDALKGPFTTGIAPFTQGATSSCQNCVWAQGVQLGVYQETTGANQKYTLIDSKGSSCGTATGAVADAHTTVQGGNTGAVTQYLQLSLQLATVSTAYGVAWPYITSSLQPPASPGPGNSQLGLTEWLATNQTTGNAWISQQGFTPTTQQPFPNIGTLWYKTLNAVTGTKLIGGTFSQTIPVDLSNGPGTGKRVQVAIWISDNQLPADSANAVTDGAPAANGAYSAVGPSANTFSFTSFTTASGRWTGYLINCAITQ